MVEQVLAPLLSEADPAESAEGAIDPLGLYQVADALAVRLVPDVRERQVRPRWLTVIAAGLRVCSGFELDALAKDGRSEPWQVFEWHVVEGLVRQAPQEQLQGVPGLLKTRQAIRDGVPMCADRYLKTPSVFGAHGIYRALARGTEIEVAGQLGDRGFELLEAWEHEQGLEGFLGGTGPGERFRRQLYDAVADGLEQGAVARKPGWNGWSMIAEHMPPGLAGPEEAKVIHQALTNAGAGHRRTVLHELTSPAGQELWWEHGSERVFHEWLTERADRSLAQLLRAILAYERWSRLLQDAFDDCLYAMSQTRRRTSPAELSQMPCVRRASGAAPKAFAEAAARLEPFEREAREFRNAFTELSEPLGPEAWVDALLEHHRRIQHHKPPHGKNPWFERFGDGSAAIRPQYLREEGGRGDDSYVHGYRTGPLWSFAQDLGIIA